MSGGSTIIGPWPSKDGAPSPIADVDTDGGVHVAFPETEDWEDEESGRDWPRIAILSACILAALGWIGIAGYTQYEALDGRTPALSDITSFIAVLSAPLALIAVLWVMYTRSSKAAARRIALTIDSLKAQETKLNATLGVLARRIADSRAMLAEEGETLSSLGDETAQRLSMMTDAMRGEVEGIQRHSNALKTSAAAARADMAVLLSDLPKAQVQARQMVSALQDAGITAHEKAGALDAQLALLTARGREADDIASGAAQKLAAHLARVEGVSEVAGARLEEAAGQMTEAVDAALTRAADALAAAREGMEAQGAAMTAMVEQGQAAMAKAGAESAEAIAQRIGTATTQVDAIAASLAEQDAATKAMLERLNTEIAAIETKLGAMGDTGTVATERASAAVLGLRDHADALSGSLQAGETLTQSLISKAETLLTALDASAREIDETLPASFARLKATADEGGQAVASIAPGLKEVETTAAETLARIKEAEALIAAQRGHIEELSAAARTTMAGNADAIAKLTTEIAAADAEARKLAEASGAQLVEALVRIKDTATQASEHTRQALTALVPESAEALGEQARTALEKALTEQVDAQMSEIAAKAEAAVESAQKATDRLMRQMLTISETSAALEARIAEAKQDVERADHSSFSRRVALLIESLNSTAIDVTKILSNEVTDTAWAAYLRGDRGVFTRRAVRLLDTGEAREIVRHYEEEPEFREQVNRYVHDFEAMLRNVLSTRDGTPLSVTLLSSDAGKLYVALAQAIDRLRS
jgi:hypothetical protein